MGQGKLGAWARAVLLQAGWAPALVLSMHVIASRGFHAYERWPNLDIPMHYAGGIAIAYFLEHAYRMSESSGLVGRPAPSLGPLVVFAWSCTAAMSWEFVEFLADRWFDARSQLGLNDTLLDMLVGVSGALSFLSLRRRRKQSRRDGTRA